MKRLLENMFSSESPSDVVIVNGISVLLTALERRYMCTYTTYMYMYMYMYEHKCVYMDRYTESLCV